MEQQGGSRGAPEYGERVKQLEKELSFYKEESGKAQAEVERLLDILREVETEKTDKDKKIAELERWGCPNVPTCGTVFHLECVLNCKCASPLTSHTHENVWNDSRDVGLGSDDSRDAGLGSDCP